MLIISNFISVCIHNLRRGIIRRNARRSHSLKQALKLVVSPTKRMVQLLLHCIQSNCCYVYSLYLITDEEVGGRRQQPENHVGACWMYKRFRGASLSQTRGSDITLSFDGQGLHVAMDHSSCQLAWSVFFCLLVRILFSFYFGLRLVFFFSLSPCSDIDPSVRRERRQGNDHQSKTRVGESLCRHIALSALSLSLPFLAGVCTVSHPEREVCLPTFRGTLCFVYLHRDVHRLFP